MKHLEWWETFTFEEKFFKTIEWLKNIGLKTDSKHPNDLTSDDIKNIYNLLGRCKFDKAWVGQCSNQANGGNCEEHSNIKCVSCGETATHECSETMQFVCGAPLCDECEHTIQSNGCNSGGILPQGLKSHCKKVEQKFKHWTEHL